MKDSYREEYILHKGVPTDIIIFIGAMRSGFQNDHGEIIISFIMEIGNLLVLIHSHPNKLVLGESSLSKEEFLIWLVLQELVVDIPSFGIHVGERSHSSTI